MKKIFYILTFLSAWLLWSCHKEPGATVTAPSTSGVFITDEGQFMHGQAEVSFYNPANDSVINGLFYAVNGYHLGDVAQSMYIKDSTGFIVVNNSQKIEVVRLPGLKHLLTINIPNSSPRYFLPVNDSVAYITDLYASQVHVINYKTGALISNITGVAEWTEHLLMVNGIVVVEERSLASNPASTGSLVTINPATNTIIQRCTFAGSNVDGIVSDNAGRIWFGMDADTAGNIPASIYCLNTDMSLNRRIILGLNRSAGNLKINGPGNQIYYFDSSGVCTLSITDTFANATAFIPQGAHNFYGLGINPSNGDVYVSDAIDYQQPSVVYRYSSNGSLLYSFRAGIISGNFAFY